MLKVNIYSKWLPDNPEITLAAYCLRCVAGPANQGRRKKGKKNTPPPTTQAAQDGGEIIGLSQRPAPVLLLLLRAITMGSTDSKLNFRKAVIQLTTKTQVSFAPCMYVCMYAQG